MAEIFNGKIYLDNKKRELEVKISQLIAEGKHPSLASIYLSEDPGSALYTKLKQRAAEAVGIRFLSYRVEDKDVKRFVSIITNLNEDDTIDGILLQKPSGKHDFDINEWSEIIQNLDPVKDVDGLTPENLGLLSIGTPRFIPATARAVLTILKSWNYKLQGKHAVIIGASEILGRPLSMLLTDSGATVSILHSKTKDLQKYSCDADLLVSATGVTGLIGAEMVKQGSAVIDVGAPKGDVLTDEVLNKTAYLSPVPGGIGPVTIACLLENLVEKILSIDKVT